MFSRSKQLAAKLEVANGRISKLRSEKEHLRSRLAELRQLQTSERPAESIPTSEFDYCADGLFVKGKNMDFLKEDRFRRAYARGVDSGHRFSPLPSDLQVEWRVHVVLWAAGTGLGLDGDFVECGVNTGIFSLAILDYFGDAMKDRKFYLFDTFQGTPLEQLDDAEREKRLQDNAAFYPDCFELATANFAPFPNARLVRGKVPDTLWKVPIEKVAYLSIDMNVASAELAALEHFWDRLSLGSPIVLDDYAWKSCETQKAAIDGFAKRVCRPVLTLPTGQGLIIKS